MEQAQEYRIKENIVNIAMNAGYLIGKGKFKIDDSDNFVKLVLDLADSFEKGVATPGQSEDYLDTIDDCALRKMMNHFVPIELLYKTTKLDRTSSSGDVHLIFRIPNGTNIVIKNGKVTSLGDELQSLLDHFIKNGQFKPYEIMSYASDEDSFGLWGTLTIKTKTT